MRDVSGVDMGCSPGVVEEAEEHLLRGTIFCRHPARGAAVGRSWSCVKVTRWVDYSTFQLWENEREKGFAFVGLFIVRKLSSSSQRYMVMLSYGLLFLLLPHLRTKEGISTRLI